MSDVKELSEEEVALSVGSVAVAKITEDVPAEVVSEVTQMVTTIKSLGPRDIDQKNAFADMTKSIGSEIRKKVAYQSDLLSSPMNAIMSKNNEEGNLSTGLFSLRKIVEEVNPNNFDLRDGGLRKLLSKLPGVGSKLEKWWNKYQSIATVIEDILRNLDIGKEALKKDNLTLRSDRDALLKYVFLLTDKLRTARLLDKEVADLIESGEYDKKFLEEDILYYLRQEEQDMELSLGAANQAIMVADIVRKANDELIRSTERTLNVSSIAIKSAAGLEVALSHQNKQINAVKATNDMTTELLQATAAKAKTQGVEIVKSANDITAQIEGMKNAFTDCIEAFDILDSYKRDALPVMAENITALDELNVKMKKTIQRAV